MDIGNNSLVDNIKKRYKKIVHAYDDLEFLSLSIEPCHKKKYINSPPGFSHEELYPDDTSGDNFNYQLYLRPQLLLYFQIIIVIGSSLSIFIFWLLNYQPEKSTDFIIILTLILLLSIINIFSYYIVLMKYLNDPVLYHYWGEDSSKHLKYWFRQIPQQVKLKKESNEVWFKGIKFKQKTTMYSSSYNKIWSAQKEIYYISLSDILSEKRRKNDYIDIILPFFPLFPTVVFLFLVVIFDSFFISVCSYTMLSITVIPIVFFILISSFVILLIDKNKTENAMNYLINNRYENSNKPSYFKFIESMVINNDDNDEKSSSDREDNNKYKLIFTIIFTLLFGSIVGLSNIKSMLNSGECSAKIYYIEIQK